MDKTFQTIDTNIYSKHRENYLPTKIKYKFVAESPPAFKGQEPVAYFYFNDVPKADSLFYTIIKAIYDLDFCKYFHNRIDLLKQFQNDGYYLIDAVEYPINKSKDGTTIPNNERQKIIAQNKNVFERHIKILIDTGKINNLTKTVLIKETVYHEYRDHNMLKVINKNSIGFPRYIKDRQTIKRIRNLI